MENSIWRRVSYNIVPSSCILLHHRNYCYDSYVHQNKVKTDSIFNGDRKRRNAEMGPGREEGREEGRGMVNEACLAVEWVVEEGRPDVLITCGDKTVTQQHSTGDVVTTGGQKVWCLGAQCQPTSSGSLWLLCVTTVPSSPLLSTNKTVVSWGSVGGDGREVASNDITIKVTLWWLTTPSPQHLRAYRPHKGGKAVLTIMTLTSFRIAAY